MTAPATTHDRPRPEPREDHEAALAALGDRVREDLAATDPRTSWSDPEDADVAVAIVGGGPAGRAPALARRRAGVGGGPGLDGPPPPPGGGSGGGGPGPRPPPPTTMFLAGNLSCTVSSLQCKTNYCRG